MDKKWFFQSYTENLVTLVPRLNDTQKLNKTLKNIPLLLLTLSIIFSCGQSNLPENGKGISEIKKPLLMKNARVSDDSISVLRIRYDEYTGSLDFVAESGTVYMTNEIYSSLVRTLQTDSTLSKTINTVDMRFSDRNDFEQLWPREGRYMTGTKYDGGWKEYIITGKVCGFDLKKRSYGSTLDIVFEMQDFHEIPRTGDYQDSEKKPSH